MFAESCYQVLLICQENTWRKNTTCISSFLVLTTCSCNQINLKHYFPVLQLFGTWVPHNLGFLLCHKDNLFCSFSRSFNEPDFVTWMSLETVEIKMWLLFRWQTANSPVGSRLQYVSKLVVTSFLLNRVLFTDLLRCFQEYSLTKYPTYRIKFDSVAKFAASYLHCWLVKTGIHFFIGCINRLDEHNIKNCLNSRPKIQLIKNSTENSNTGNIPHSQPLFIIDCYFKRYIYIYTCTNGSF